MFEFKLQNPFLWVGIGLEILSVHLSIYQLINVYCIFIFIAFFIIANFILIYQQKSHTREKNNKQLMYTKWLQF